MTNLLTICDNNNNTIIESNFKTGFGSLQKLNEVKNLGFPFLTKTQIEDFVDEKCNDNLVEQKTDMEFYLEEHNYQKNSFLFLGIEEIYEDMCDFSVKIHYKKQNTNIGKTEGLVAQKNIQLLNRIYTVGIIETEISNYKEIPPAHILIIENKVSQMNVFDKITVLEPYKKDITPIKDPILCGKINGHDDIFFILGVWDSNVDTEKFLINGSKELIEESKKFISEFSQYAHIGMEKLGLKTQYLLN